VDLYIIAQVAYYVDDIDPVELQDATDAVHACDLDDGAPVTTFSVVVHADDAVAVQAHYAALVASYYDAMHTADLDFV